ncbi:hypothetical protein MSAN_02411700 [Mycena sanguinolenta]|uniref:Uncharacterized protein n=1 Tax=Mycena sanguinolenta TaxID=230812 RepID=A0A8H7CEP3_9AGAR|nr:hypothetical protein MSAN_02411700 [Mycena sanguinolenta]
MQFLASSLVVLLCALLGHSQAAAANVNCRNVPGSPGYPTTAEWDALNATERGKANGKIAVGPTAATVCPGAGWVQGAGPSALAPTFGLGADNALEFEIIVASGELLKVNENSYSDLFYALRGGGAGSWGVVVSVTFQAYSIFNARSSLIILVVEDDNVASSLATLHAQHVFDWDSVHAGQYFLFLKNDTSADAPSLHLTTEYVVHAKHDHSSKRSAIDTVPQCITGAPGHIAADDSVGSNTVLRSSLISAATYRDSPATIGKAYKQLLAGGATAILGHLVAGGKVAANAEILALPHSRSAIKQHLDAERKALVNKEWTESARYEKTMAFDSRLNKGSYITFTDLHPRSLAVLLLQLRTGHIPLAKHLHRIRKLDSPICPSCRQADESVAHFLLWCPHHAPARQLLHAAVGPDSLALHKLLGTGKSLPHLFKFLRRTGRFRNVHGTLPQPPDPEKPAPNELFNFLANFRFPQRFARDADPLNDPRVPPGFLEAWAEMQAGHLPSSTPE